LASSSLTLPVQAPAPAPAPAPPPAPTPMPTPRPAPGSAPALAKPGSIAAPRLRRSGGHVTCDAGRWSNSPTGFSFAWRVDGRTRAGATGRTLVVTRRLHGHVVQCAVTAANGAGRSTALSQRLAVR
jgi:hypothetical protein